jgi:hypothetical protein
MDYKVKGAQRAKKLAGREKFRQNPVNGVAMKRLLVERAAKARRTPAEQFEVETRPTGRYLAADGYTPTVRGWKNTPSRG